MAFRGFCIWTLHLYTVSYPSISIYIRTVSIHPSINLYQAIYCIHPSIFINLYTVSTHLSPSICIYILYPSIHPSIHPYSSIYCIYPLISIYKLYLSIHRSVHKAYSINLQISQFFLNFFQNLKLELNWNLKGIFNAVNCTLSCWEPWDRPASGLIMHNFELGMKKYC